MSQPRMSISELLKNSPRNWGKWGPDDEVGTLNYLTPERMVAAAMLVRQGKVFTLQARMADPDGDPVYPTRESAKRFQLNDKSSYTSGRCEPHPGGLEVAEDAMFTNLQGSTQYDALGHAWYDDQIWNGYPAASTVGGLRRASILPIAERGVVGRGILLDIARYRNKEILDPGEAFGLADLLACADAQGVAIRPGDVLVLRTGWIGKFFSQGRSAFYADFKDPGLQYSEDLVAWFKSAEIANLVTDTIANELVVDPETGIMCALHGALMRNLGLVLTEVAHLDPLADDCRHDGCYEFLYVAAPLKVVDAAGAPVNPVAIK